MKILMSEIHTDFYQMICLIYSIQQGERLNFSIMMVINILFKHLKLILIDKLMKDEVR